MSEFTSMIKTTDIVERTIDSFEKNELKVPKSSKVYTIVIDTSGSTQAKFKNSVTVLEKEQEIIMQFILKNSSENPNDKYYLYSFGCKFKYHGKINFLLDEGIVNLPDMISNYTTETSAPLKDIYKNLNVVKPDVIMLITDGQTNSGNNQEEIKRIVPLLKEKNIEIHAVAVGRENKNLEYLNEREELNLPGMDLVNLVRNDIDKLEIYNLFHENEPYRGSTSSQINKNNIKFLGVVIDVPVVNFLNSLVKKIYEICSVNSTAINWGTNQIDLKKMLIEIGKLWSLLIIEFDETHPFITNTCETLSHVLPSDMTIERIIKLITYGVKCTKNNEPIVLTNLEERAKQAVVKKNQFADASASLKSKGTALGCNKLISIPNVTGMCLIVQRECYATTFDRDNVSKDRFGNVFFGIPNDDDNSLDQAIRIGFRNYASSLGFQNPRGSPDVIFFVASEMIKLFIKGEEFESEYMNVLRKLAIIQCSMEGKISKEMYDGVGFFFKWKSGIIPPKHFSNKETHTNCYLSKIVNPFGFSESIWWASMMLALGIFNEQLLNYKNSIEGLGFEATEEGFKKFLRTYQDKIEGNTVFYKTLPKKTSVFTLEDFPSDEPIYRFKDHGRQICSANTWYSRSEVKEYLKSNGCVWCRTIPRDEDLELVTQENFEEIIQKMSLECKPLKVTSRDEVSTLSGMMSSLSTTDVDTTLTSATNKYVIHLVGITGAGKTTTREIIINILTLNNINYIVASPDDKSKRGIKGKAMAKQIKKDIENFDKYRRDSKKVVIIDVCNEKGIDDNAFKFDFPRNGYNKIVFYPNFNKDMFKEYCAWCLRNVLLRKKCNENCNYYLNPVDASVSVCIKVHNMKAEGIRNICGTTGTNVNVLESDTQEQALNKINDDAEQYNAYLATLDHRETIMNLLQNNLVIE